MGMSHKSAPIDLLERVSLDTDSAVKLSQNVLDTEFVSEAIVVSTCNRVEIYVEADRFHGSVEEMSTLLADQAGLDRDDFVANVYVHYDEAVVAHLFAVAAGLDSMIPGESQILGQVRDALQVAQAESTVGSALNLLFQQALRIGKRGHAETGIDRLGSSIVAASFDAAGDKITGVSTRFLVAGAGTMASLAVKTLIERGVAPSHIMVANRTFQRAYELVATFGVSAVRWQSLDIELAHADVLITCTGASGIVFDKRRIEAGREDQDMVLIDLALPRDIDAAAGTLDGVTLIDLQTLSDRVESVELTREIERVREIVADEVSAFLAARAASTVTPTVVALRTMATDVVAGELARLQSRRPDLDDSTLSDVRQALKRVADKLIHSPTVRIQELAGGPNGLTYADALADLFALDPASINAVSTVSGERG